MIMKGQKRKLPPETPEVSDRTSPFWESQRQFVFSVSLNKYQRGQELPEPSLRRSVLIANTLRQVSLEACTAPSADGEVSQPLFDPSSPLQENVFSPSPTLSAKEEDDEWDSMSTDPDFSLSAAISSILTALDSAIDGSPQAAPRTPLRSLENLAGPSEGGVVWMRQNLKCLPSFSSFSASSSSSSPALPPPPLTGPTYLREGLELDHLMEILVES